MLVQLTIMAVTGTIISTLYYIIYPVILLGKALFSVVCSLLIPFVHLGRIVLYLLLIPFRILAKFESLYTFLGVAVLIGIIAGLSLYFLHRSIGQVLQLSPSEAKHQLLQKGSKLLPDPIIPRQWSQPRSPIEDFSASAGSHSKERAFFVRGPSVSSNGDNMPSGLYAEWASGKDKTILKDNGLFSTTILEEEDDNDDFQKF